MQPGCHKIRECGRIEELEGHEEDGVTILTYNM